MKRSLRAALCGVVLAALAAPALTTPAWAAAPSIEGDWGHYFPTPGQAAPDPKLAPPPAPPPPLKPEYLKAYQAHQAAAKAADIKGEPLAGASVACLPDGMPQMMFAIYPLEILVNQGKVTVIEEAYSQVRHIFLDQPQTRIEDTAPGYYGHSVGHWEGDTLVVDTIAVKESVLIGRDVHHSDQMRLTERIHLATPDVLHDEITIDDPVMFEHPWSFTYAYRRLPGYQMLEYVCEDNREYVDENGGTHLRLKGS